MEPNTKGIVIGVSVSVAVVVVLAGICCYLKKRQDEFDKLKGNSLDLAKIHQD